MAERSEAAAAVDDCGKKIKIIVYKYVRCAWCIEDSGYDRMLDAIRSINDSSTKVGFYPARIGKVNAGGSNQKMIGHGAG